MKFGQTLIQFSTALLIALTFLSSCGDETSNNPIITNDDPITVGEAIKEYPEVDSRLWAYFQRFEEAGNERGYNTDLIEAGVTATLNHIENGAAGSCSMNTSHTVHHLTLDIDFWNTASETLKEIIVFHELGHCHLHRGHDDSRHSNGTCKSLMRSGLGTCIDNYTSTTRDNYLDELFDNQ